VIDQLHWAGLALRSRVVIPTRATLQHHLPGQRQGAPGIAEVFGHNLGRRRRASGLSQEEIGFRASLAVPRSVSSSAGNEARADTS
jgi:hypothetical protein